MPKRSSTVTTLSASDKYDKRLARAICVGDAASAGATLASLGPISRFALPYCKLLE